MGRHTGKDTCRYDQPVQGSHVIQVWIYAYGDTINHELF